MAPKAKPKAESPRETEGRPSSPTTANSKPEAVAKPPRPKSANALKTEAKAKSRGPSERSKSPRPKEASIASPETEAKDESPPQKQASAASPKSEASSISPLQKQGSAAPAKTKAKAKSPLEKQAPGALGDAAAAQGAEARGPSLPAAAPAPTREHLTARAQEEQKQALGSVWFQISKGKNDLRTADIERLLVAANSVATGQCARVDVDAVREFMKTEFGANSNVNEAVFVEKASAYFKNCAPTEECGEVWQMLGGSLTKGGTVEAAELRDMLQRLNYDITKGEAEDLVAIASKGSGRMSYDDFVQTLFP